MAAHLRRPGRKREGVSSVACGLAWIFLLSSRPVAPSAPAHKGKASGPDRSIIGTYAMRPRMDLLQVWMSRRRRRTDLAPMCAIDVTARARDIYGTHGREKRWVPEHRAQPIQAVLLPRPEKRALPSFPPLRKSTLAMAFVGVPRRVSPASLPGETVGHVQA